MLKMIRSIIAIQVRKMKLTLGFLKRKPSLDLMLDLINQIRIAILILAMSFHLGVALGVILQQLREKFSRRKKVTEEFYRHISRNKIWVIPSEEYRNMNKVRPYFDIILKDMKFTQAKRERERMKRQHQKEENIK